MHVDVSSWAQSFLRRFMAGALAAAALAFVAARFGESRKVGEEGAHVWFYDLSEKRLYPVPAGTVPPHQGVGGVREDGVRAVVVGFRGESHESRRIAYLETYTPALKTLLEEVRAARRDRRSPTFSMPTRGSQFYQENTLVRKPDDDEWRPLNSPEAERITSEWRHWQGPAGQPPGVLTP